MATAPDDQAALLACGMGLFDLQANGYAGIDFNDAAVSADAMDHALHAMLAAGVTHCLPTLITATASELAARFAALDAAVARSRLGPMMVPGYHLEGPFLNPAPGYAGCHPPQAMIAPDPALVARLESGLNRPILVLTIAPERAGALDLIRWARGRGKLVAIGHSAASPEDVQRAADAGCGLSTHLGNALPQVLAKLANALMAQLAEDRLAASFIADGIHVPPFALKAMIRAKGIARSILVTDATAAAAAPPGLYHFAGMPVEHAADGSVRVPGAPNLAGSALVLDQAVRNIAAWGIASPADALRMASGNPAALLAPALAAHGVALTAAEAIWSADLRPRQVCVGGIRVSA